MVAPAAVGAREVLAPERLLPVTTAEGVPLELDLAGVGARGLAAAVDLALAAVVIALLAAARVRVLADSRPELAPTGTRWVDAAVRLGLRCLVPAVLAAVLTPLLLELAFRGRTLGKRLFGLQVVDAVTGSRAHPPALLTRNLLRPLDLLPGSYAVGALVLLATPRAQRLGDLAAGTAVVRRRRQAPAYGVLTLPAPVWQAMGPPTRDGQSVAVAGLDTSGWDTRGLTAGQRELLQAFAARRFSLPPGVRASFTEWLAEVLRRVVDDVPPELPDELFLDALLLRLARAR